MPFSFPDRPECTTEQLRTDLKEQLFPHISRKVITATLGTTQVAIAHGLKEPPSWIGVTPRGDARVWRSADSSKDFIFLTASATVVCDIEVSIA